MSVFTLDSKGRITFADDNHIFIQNSAIGTVIMNGCAYVPVAAQKAGEIAEITYPCGKVIIKIEECKGYQKLTILSVPEGCEHFIFGPYETKGSSFGEILGASWYEDGAVSCIQSLMPKVVGGAKYCRQSLWYGVHKPQPEEPKENQTDFFFEALNKAAVMYQGKVYLQCTANDLTKESAEENSDVFLPVPAPDGLIEGGAVALIGANSAGELLDIIEGMELAEGMPHPMYRGNYAKKDRRATNYYLIFTESDQVILENEKRLEMAGRANINCVYFCDLFSEWGHFTIDEKIIPGGIEGVRKLSDYAAQYGVDIGTHSLSNFIHTHDRFVSPIPNKDLLIRDRTRLQREVSREDTEIYVEHEVNYGKTSTLNAFRIGDELLTFEGYDKERGCITGCTRGAFGTVISAHQKGEAVDRLWDHNYRTLFPNITLQEEMIGNLAEKIRDGKIRRLSFDGLEGCLYTGCGDYATSEFVRKLFEINGNELICDASLSNHYLWHAHSYYNWGEPWYDHVRRGGSHAYRTKNLSYFKRNLLPCMMGWYSIYTNRGRYEATTPENMEFMLSRAAAFDAGLALSVSTEAALHHGMFGEYLDLMRLWGDFRIEADIPEKVRERMQEENSNWHLEKTEDGWRLDELIVTNLDLDYCDRNVKAEAGIVEQKLSGDHIEGRVNHSSHIWVDGIYEGVEDKMRFRLRVGEPGQGFLENLEFPTLKFRFTAEGGDYLVYEGDTTLYHYDQNFHLKEVIQGEGTPIQRGRYTIVNYMTDHNPHARYIMTEFKKRRTYQISKRED